MTTPAVERAVAKLLSDQGDVIAKVDRERRNVVVGLAAVVYLAIVCSSEKPWPRDSE